MTQIDPRSLPRFLLLGSRRAAQVGRVHLRVVGDVPLVALASLTHPVVMVLGTGDGRAARVEPHGMLRPPIRSWAMTKQMLAHRQAMLLRTIRQCHLLQRALKPPRVVGVEIIAIFEEHFANSLRVDWLPNLLIARRIRARLHHRSYARLLLAVLLRSHGRLGNAPPFVRCQLRCRPSLGPVVLPREPIRVRIDLGKELMQGPRLRVTATGLGQPLANPGKVIPTIAQHAARLSESQSFGLLPW